MRLFRKRRTDTRNENAFAAGIRRFAERKQRKAAEWLGRKTLYWNHSSKIIALTLFCLLFGGLCLLLLLKAIIHL